MLASRKRASPGAAFFYQSLHSHVNASWIASLGVSGFVRAIFFSQLKSQTAIKAEPPGILIRMRPKFVTPLTILSLAALYLLFPLHSQQKPLSLLILNAQIADGTGAPLYKANIRIAYNQIIQIGNLQPEKDESTLDAKGLVLAPGFIDVHNHSTEGLASDPL